ncbi:MAG: hypothetical protein EXQ56_11950 [Acidobacteria bacterium]|nr:hypothetical protein [Acidobacteriota bacterium]
MILINEAFAVLSDERRRKAFDRELLLERSPTSIPLATPSASNDWEIPVAPMSRPGAGKPRQNLDVDKSVSQDFFEKVKLQVMQAGESAKMKDESEPGWMWSLQGKTWGGNYWVALRIFPVLNPNITRELLKQIDALMSKRRSGWKNNAFVFVLGFQSLQESDMVLRLIRTYCLREEYSVPRNMLNILVMDAAQRRSIVCGKRAGDEVLQALLSALGASA